MLDVIKGRFGNDITITESRPVYGGDINEAYCVNLSDGSRVFLKTNTIGKADMFRGEAEGLSAIGRTGEIRVPEPIGYGIDRDMGRSYLLLSYIEKGRPRAGYWEDFGRRLAHMHLYDFDSQCGFDKDNYIGSTVQKNDRSESWIDFYRSCRLEPQIQMARRYFDGDLMADAHRLLDRLDALLPEPERRSLLHGDLWGGNAMAGDDGYVWIYDPAVYVGHNEADIAMTQLFGGFAAEFYDGYNEVLPISPYFSDYKELYDLYHLLNHLNLFGRSYLPAVARIIRRYR